MNSRQVKKLGMKKCRIARGRRREGCRAAGCTVTQGEEYGLVLADTPPASNKQLMQLSMHHQTPPSASHVATLNTYKSNHHVKRHNLNDNQNSHKLKTMRSQEATKNGNINNNFSQLTLSVVTNALF